MGTRGRTGWLGGAWIACAAGVLAIAGCSSSSPHSSVDSTGGASSPLSTTAPTQHVTETNPPGDIPDTQVFVTYQGQGFSVQVPEGWARTGSGSAVAFTDKYNSITITTIAALQAPTAATARSQEIPKIKAAESGFANPNVQVVQRPAGHVVLITYTADSRPNAVTGKVAVEAVERYEFYRNGKELVLTLAAPKGSDNVDPWHKVTTSFAWA